MEILVSKRKLLVAKFVEIIVTQGEEWPKKKLEKLNIKDKNMFLR